MGTRMKFMLWLAVFLVVGFFGVGFAGLSTPEGQEKANARRTIEACWDDQKKKSLDPSTQRFVAGVCEGLEDKFVAKHGHRP